MSWNGICWGRRRFGHLAAGVLAAVFLWPAFAYADETRATLVTDTGSYDFTVEVVDTPQSRAKGLMYRTDLAPDAGMLFDFKEERETAFWMQNTLIGLDMIFIRADGTVRTVHANAIPHDTTSIPSGGPVQFVLEIPAGRAAEIGLKPGDRLAHDRIAK
jgi:uncharacterized protein